MILDDPHNLLVLETVIPFCNQIYEITNSSNVSWEKATEYRKKGEELFKKNFPDRTKEDMEYFNDNAYAIYQQLTGCHYFAGKTSFWKECFQKK
jgi:hypothetical protein